MIRWLLRIRQDCLLLADAGLDMLFPPRCAHCDVDLPGPGGAAALCPRCLDRLGPTIRHGCRRCGGEVFEHMADADDCPLCKDTVLHFDAAVALGNYHAGLNNVVLRMKRPANDALSAAMGRLLVERRRELLAELRPDVIMPIPMFWLRRFGRGTNSADILARCLGESLSIPVRRNVLTRRRNTLPQANLPPSRRLLNVRGAFRVRRRQAVKDARIMLVDDVLTTGATCSEAAKTLKQAGAAGVVVAVVARAGDRQ